MPIPPPNIAPPQEDESQPDALDADEAQQPQQHVYLRTIEGTSKGLISMMVISKPFFKVWMRSSKLEH